MTLGPELPILLEIIFLFCLISTIQLSAQEEQNAVLEVRIWPVITFTLNDLNPTLIFDEADDFINGVSYTASGAAEVTASAAFSVEVKARDSHLRIDTCRYIHHFNRCSERPTAR